MFKTEQNTVVAILADLRNILSRNPTCTKTETISFGTSAAVKLNPPANCFLAKVSLETIAGGASTGVAKFSECSTTAASSTVGINMNTNTIYEIKGPNNINGFSVISLATSTIKLNVEYFTY